MTRPIKSVAYCLFMAPSYEFSKRLKTSLTSLSKDFLQMPVNAVDPWILSSCSRRYSEHRQRHCPLKCGKTTQLQGISRHWAKSKIDKPPSPGANPRLPRNTLLDENRHESRQNFPQPRVTTGKWGGGERGPRNLVQITLRAPRTSHRVTWDVGAPYFGFCWEILFFSFLSRGTFTYVPSITKHFLALWLYSYRATIRGSHLRKDVFRGESMKN